MADNEENNEYIFELSQDVARFDPITTVTNVFFDDTSRQVFAVRSGGVMGVVVEGPTPELSTNFRMEDKGPVISIKFSPDQKVLAVQRSNTSVEFMNFHGGEIDPVEYSQSAKGKNHNILGFLWTSVNKILFVTDHGAELFQVVSEKKMLKSLKAHSVSVKWFVYCPQTCLVLLSSGVLGNQMYPLMVKKFDVNRLSKFDIDLPTVPKPSKLLERDITLGVLYGEASIIVLRHNPHGSGSQGADVVVYTLVEMTAKKTHLLHLDMCGRFAVNIVDNLVIVHHQASKKSMMFDIMMSGESDGPVTYHQPILGQHPMKPFVLTQPALPSKIHTEPAQMQCELYSPNWVVFQPNIIIDAKLGCLWTLELNIQPLVKAFNDKCLLVDFLLRRSNSKPVVLQVLQDILKPFPENKKYYTMVSGIFGYINEAYRNSIKADLQSQLAMPATSSLKILPSRPLLPSVNVPPKVVIAQSDIYTNVFSKMVDSSRSQAEGLPDSQDIGKFEVWVLLEYISSLTDFHIPVQVFMHELLIQSLVQHKQYYQLHQLLQYHVVSDSKHVACQLLSLENLYPAAYQLALDMLKRLNETASEEIIEILLSKQQIFPALRFIHSSGTVGQVSARKFLEAAKQTGDPAVFLAVYKFFELRNLQQKGTSFTKDEHYDQFVKYYHSLCNSDKNLNSLKDHENL